MIRVKNRKIICKLAVKNFNSAQTRNIIAVFAIALTSLLFTGMFTMGFGMVKSIQRADMIMSGGDGQARINYMTESEYDNISSHSLIKEIAYCRKLADSVDNQSLMKRYTEFWYYDDLGLKYAFVEPTIGHKPQTEKEIITDTTTLEMLGIPQKLGTHIKLEFTIHNKKVARDFILAGWWKSYPGVRNGTIIASKAYVNAHLDELKSTYRQDREETGTIAGIIKFKDEQNIEKDLEKVVKDSGFSMDLNAQNYINTGINPRYLSKHTTVGIGTAGALSCALLLVVFTGYLIIYNIFQISVLHDMHFYGLLKTIGTTGRQLYGIINRQAFMLSLLGIPLGLCGGFLMGKALLPTLLIQSSFKGNTVIVSPNPFIFMLASIFTLITVFISVRKPAKMAAEVSPMEAVSYTDYNFNNGKKKKKKTRNGNPQKRMAWANLGRNKKRTVLVIISLSLSIVLTNTVFNFSQSVDPENALKNANTSDFCIGNTDLFFQYKVNAESALSESFITAVEQHDGFKTGGRQYGCRATYTSKTTKQTCSNQQKDGSFPTHIYGMDEFPFSRMKLVDGEIDIEKLATGKYILEGAWVDSRGHMDMKSMNHSIGDKLELNYNGNIHEVTVLGHVIANEGNTYDWVDSCFFLPVEGYKEVTGNTYTMSYVFDATEDKEADMEEFLKNYTNSVEPTMSYKSKLNTLAGVTDIKNTIILIGGTIAFIIGIIGILNFINTILTSILVRRKELAILQSIGMTKRQLVEMLCLEGCYYVIFTLVISILLSIGSSLFIVRPLCNQIWFLNFKFNFLSLVIIFPILFVLGLLIPYVAYHFMGKKSIVELLRVDGL
ncbi:ABC transporter permease [Clostridium sp. ATCC 25772]|uniref:ABC transporter permease n=1 Tax=Clostridium sp. ATCC 25772 TaxID=1676991 RepID=UPI0007812E25|nr:ABC transporter permease [Clostridium sp. ATCC 25772]